MSNLPPKPAQPASALDPALLRELLDAAPDPMVVVDATGRIVFVNLRTEDMFGYARDALTGREIELLIPERFRATHMQHREDFSSTPKVRPMGSGVLLHGRRADGSEFPLEISLSPLNTTHGLLISASIRDITARRERDAEVRRIQQHLLSAVESIQGAFVIFDAERRAVLCNSSFQVLLGQYVPGGIVGHSLDEIVRRSAAAGVFDLKDSDIDAFCAGWLAYHDHPAGALELRTQTGRNLRVIERRTAEGGTVAIIDDISDDVQREDELRRARAIAEAASSAKSEFLASMSHELRTPLNAILGFAQLLQRDKKTPLSERQLERVEHVLKGGAHLLQLIDEVLDLSRIEVGSVTVSLEPVGVEELIREVITTLETMASRAQNRLELVSSVPLQVVADRTRLRQILMNYGSNAIKYGRPNGSTRFSVELHGKLVRICVSDDGIGIPEAKQDKIFQPFQRAGQESGTIEGTGIGLAITKRLAELMKGEVGFLSTEGVGSEFWIELPAQGPKVSAAAAAHAATTDPSPLAAAQGPHYRVVYVEDNPANVAFMQDLLQDFERLELLVAPNAELGLELVRSRRPHAVIMDINLPGMSGLEALKRMQEMSETKHIPVVGLSAAAMVQDAKRVANAGFYRYLTKPVQVDELMSVLEEILGRAGDV